MQAGLRLCFLQTPEDRLSRVEAHFIGDKITTDKNKWKDKQNDKINRA